MMWIIVFFILFECILNGIAEITFFDDREFYQDWWNSTTFDEFARKVEIPSPSRLPRPCLAAVHFTSDRVCLRGCVRAACVLRCHLCDWKLP